MRKIIVAVGSKRLPKLNAVWEALNVVGPTLDPDAQFEIVGEDAESGVRHTPLSRAEIMAGARRRADMLIATAREGNRPWAYFVGLEGGLDVMDSTDFAGASGGHEFGAGAPPATGSFGALVLAAHPTRLVFLQNWAYVSDGKRGAFGQSGSILIPDALAAKVVDGGVELAKAIDEFAGGRGIRDAQGAWGVFTRNMITRQDAFRVAVINAFAPFFNRSRYTP